MIGPQQQRRMQHCEQRSALDGPVDITRFRGSEVVYIYLLCELIGC